MGMYDKGWLDGYNVGFQRGSEGLAKAELTNKRLEDTIQEFADKMDECTVTHEDLGYVHPRVILKRLRQEIYKRDDRRQPAE